MFDQILDHIRQLYGEGTIPLHEPRFLGNEKKYLCECIDSTYVSYLGAFVDRFENMVKEFTGAQYAIATVNATTGLHAALIASGVTAGTAVLTVALTFVATANAIRHAGADPIFVDSDRETLGMSPEKLSHFLQTEAIRKNDGQIYDRESGRRIAACVPVHVFGHGADTVAIKAICDDYAIPVIEDSAEALGSFSGSRHLGTVGSMGVLSFNGNKIITTGGGGMIITDSGPLAQRVRHLVTTAKLAHSWEFIHDEAGYNYRLPNLNAAVGCAQMEELPRFLADKRALAESYASFFKSLGIPFVSEPKDCHSNYWLNAIMFSHRNERDDFLGYSHGHGVMCRPAWRLMTELAMYKDCRHDGLEEAKWLEERIVNIPSSVRV
jgi:perosamine synthetase